MGEQERADDARMGHLSGRLGCVSTPLPKGGRFVPLPPPAAYTEPHPVPTLGTPVGGGLMGVHCHHPLHGVTGRTRVITPGAGSSTLDHPTPSPPTLAMTASWTATAAGETVGQRPRKPMSAEQDSAEFFPGCPRHLEAFLLSKRPVLSTALRQPPKTLAWEDRITEV